MRAPRPEVRTGLTIAAAIAPLALVIPAGGAGARAQALPPPPVLRSSPWAADWVLSASRNPPAIRVAAADGYRFTLDGHGGLTWEIPTLHEVVRLKLGGRFAAIERPGTKGAMLAVRAEGPWTLTYRLTQDGRPAGEGRMTLVDQGRAWIDISQPSGRPDLAGAVVYVRPGAA